MSMRAPASRKCQTLSKRRTDGRTDKHARQQRPPRSPPSRRGDVAATDEETRPSVRLLDGVWHSTSWAIISYRRWLPLSHCTPFL